MAHKAEVYLYDCLTGILIEDEAGYDFRYDDFGEITMRERIYACL